MKGFCLALLLVTLSVSVSNTQQSLPVLNAENKIFLITLDGFRWEEMFSGADSALIHDPGFTSDTTLFKALYWDKSPEERRKKLLPFFWNVMGAQGQLHGNRAYGNKVNVSNPYALSYPGYSELLTGSVDFTIHNNSRKRNKNKNLLEVLSKSSAFGGRVAAFTSWNAFPYILNKEENNFVLNSGLPSLQSKTPTRSEQWVNTLQAERLPEEPETRYDELTYLACKEYIVNHQPGFVFLSFSGTDNAGHEKQYDTYLKEANNADRMISDLWRLVQSMPEYKGKTTFIITTDHGRGGKKSNWNKHGFFVPGSSQTWFALLGHHIVPAGELKMKNQVYQKELNALILELLSKP